MIKTDDAIRIARSLIGTPYKELDCINLIKKVIRTAPGGVPGYTTAGTNALWKSRTASQKYRDLVSYETGLSGARAGMIAFKAAGENFHHAGIVTRDGTVIHSSSTQGGRGVVETPLTSREGWTHLATHRYIETASTEEEEPMSSAQYWAKVNTQDDPLTLRDAPDGDKIGSLPIGATVTVLAERDGWSFVQYGGQSGYAATRYLTKTEAPAQEEEPYMTLIRDDGTFIRIAGKWRAAED